MQTFRQNSIVFKKPGLLYKKLQTNFAHISYLPMSAKASLGFFLFCLDSFLQKSKKIQFLNTFFYIFIDNSRYKQSKKILNTLLQTLLSRKPLQIFSKKKLNFVVVRAHQRFQFFGQIAWFLEIIGICLYLGIGFCIT